jgi:hypothetical protein
MPHTHISASNSNDLFCESPPRSSQTIPSGWPHALQTVFTMIILAVFSILGIAAGSLVVRLVERRRDVLYGPYVRREPLD